MGSRFRLIYLKSSEPGKTASNEISAIPHSNKIFEKVEVATPIEYHPGGTLSSQVFLNQVKVDLKHPDPKVRILAIQYLEKCDPSISIPLVQEILIDQDPDVRAQALRSLVKFRHPDINPLLKKYLKDNDPRVRMAALRGILNEGGKIDLNILLQCLSDESSWVRRKMATLLGWTQMDGAFPILVEMSRDQDSQVKKAAFLSLISLYPDEGKDRLMEATTDPDPDLRKWARGILAKMASKSLKGMVPVSNRN